NKKPEKHIPERTCVACREVKGKREMVRLVRSPEGIIIDESGKVSGRGAYLCKSSDCWDEGLKGNRLEQVLRCHITPADKKILEEYKNRL
ncbi:MAG TPA: YlxR family protein, partial [Dehalococcoidales bacterium]|nr:YlxR family protein [Dehalococcoidales bacterium]